MNKPDSEKIALLIVIIGLSVVYFWDIRQVPFHPDESTEIFSSADMQDFLHSPAALFWYPANTQDLRQHYRLVDPPLTRTWIGLGRLVTQQPALPADWNWSLSWSENVQAGALPDQALLDSSRLAVALFFPFSLWLAFLIGAALRSRLTGWLNLFLTASNALVLIHTRRAMAESLLLFGCLLTLWAILHWRKKAWLATFPAALAFNAKYSALPYLGLVLLAICIGRDGQRTNLRTRIYQLGGALALFLAVTFALNPVLWASPLRALRETAQQRAELMTSQAAEFNALSPAESPTTLGGKLTALVGELFILPPAAQDVGNYRDQIDPQAESYLANPLNALFRGLYAGGLMLFLFLAGLVFSIKEILKKPFQQSSTNMILFLVGFVLQIVSQLALVQVVFQRYYLTFLPYVTTLVALALASIMALFTQKSPLAERKI